MPNSDEMTIGERYKYRRIRQNKYGKAGHLERRRMLDEMQQVTGLDRKTLRHMRGKIDRKARKRQRGGRRSEGDRGEP